MASRFWVGGTGTWDNSTTTHWASSSGGAGGASVPAAADTVTFDASSGGGVVTVAATINGTNSLQQLTMGAFTGTLDFSVNNPSITLAGGGFSITGTATRTLNMGSGTFTMTGGSTAVWDCGTVTGLTFNAGTSNIVVAPSGLSNTTTVNFGGLTYSTFTLGPSGGVVISIGSTTATIAHLVCVGPVQVTIVNMTVTTSMNSNGSISGPVEMRNATAGTVSTITLNSPGAVASWTSMAGITFATNSLTATNSWNMGSVTNATITNPSANSNSVFGA
jgi:hypothetical protein